MGNLFVGDADGLRLEPLLLKTDTVLLHHLSHPPKRAARHRGIVEPLRGERGPHVRVAGGVARGLERLGGVFVDRFVVRMAVDSLPVKGDHNLGPESPDLLD